MKPTRFEPDLHNSFCMCHLPYTVCFCYLSICYIYANQISNTGSLIAFCWKRNNLWTSNLCKVAPFMVYKCENRKALKTSLAHVILTPWTSSDKFYSCIFRLLSGLHRHLLQSFLLGPRCSLRKRLKKIRLDLWFLYVFFLIFTEVSQ